MKCPTITELDKGSFVGPLLSDIFKAAGIDDSDLPDIIPDDIDCDDHDALVATFPKLAAKLAALWDDPKDAD